jgi:glycine/D-amino acid oxidase-like deaminating enzyme
MRIAVIGSGVSGLTAAALLAQAHHRVIVYEQSEMIGGVTAGIEKDGYRWDLGQMLLPDDLSALGSRKGLAAKLKMLRKYLPIRRMRGWSTRALLDSLFTDHRLKAVFSAILADYVTGLEDFRVHTHLAHHAFGGCPPRLDRSPPPHRTPIRGLWFIGAQSEAYGGVTGGMVGAQKTVTMLPRQRA